MDYFKKAKRKHLTHRKFLPKTLYEVKDIMEGRRKAIERRVLREVKKMDKIIQAIPEKTKAELDAKHEQMKLLDRAIRGEEVECLNADLAKWRSK